MKYKIGTKVFFKDVIFYYHNKNRIFEVQDKKRLGIIVGGTYKCTGTGNINSEINELTGRYCSYNYLIIDKKYFVYLIRTGFINKPLMAFENNITQIEFDDFKSELDIPYQYNYYFEG